MQPGDAEHGVAHAVALQAAVPQYLPGPHPGKGVLDAGTDLFVRAVVFLLPVGQFLASPAAVGHHESGARIATVSDRQGVADCSLCPGLLPCLAVVAVARQWPADYDDEPGVRVDDDLVVGRVAVALDCSATW